MGNLYRCGFVHENEEDFIEYITEFSNDAAVFFAHQAFDIGGMWEHSEYWENEYAVKVIDEQGNIEIYNINVEMIPEFNAEFVKKE